MIEGRTLRRDEIKDVWTIDRTELIEEIYYLVDDSLELRPERYDMHGWPPGEAEKYTHLMEKSHDVGAWLFGLFNEGTLIGSAIVEHEFIGPQSNLLQLSFLHVSNKFRGQGLGRGLFHRAAEEARLRGAHGLYISATPSRNTVDFYLRLGCVLTRHPIERLLALEPLDIHLEYSL